MDVILLAYEFFSGDHQFVQVVHKAEGRADSNTVVPWKEKKSDVEFRRLELGGGEGEKHCTCTVHLPAGRR